MALSVPQYIADADITSAALNYEWGDEHEDHYFADEVPPLRKKIAKIAKRSQLTLAAGIAEWVAWRLSSHSDDRVLFDCIEALYAGVVDWHYFDPGDPRTGLAWTDWEGSVRMPLCLAARRLITMFDKARSDLATARHAVFLSKLVEHVLPDAVEPFRAWRNTTIDRLRELAPLDRADSAGATIPRQVLDPQFDYRPGSEAELLASFLSGVDHGSNPFLNSPEQMLKAGFEGTPYQL